MILISLVGFGLVAVACLSYAYFIEPTRLVVDRSEIAIEGLDRAFDGLRIVMIGDIHGGSNGVDEQKLRKIVEVSNQQDPDLVVLLGDYVSQSQERTPTGGRTLKMPIQTIAKGISGLRAKYGVFVVLGNHDGFFGDSIVAAVFNGVGYKVLQNEVAAIEVNGKRLRILGFRDHLRLAPQWTETSAIAKQLLASSGEGQVIALEHSPDILPMLTGDLSIGPDLKLVLAAHTHGGQVWLPLLGTPIVPSNYGQKYSYGHIRENDVDMFVTSGIGTSILPIRFMMPPQISLLTLRSVER